MKNIIKQNKAIIFFTAIVIVIIAGLFLFSNNSNVNETENNTSTPSPTIATQVTAPGPDPLNASYNIDDQIITLTNGVHTEQIPNSSTVIETKNFNEPIYGELTGKPKDPEDATFIIESNPGGSGTFYYVVANLSTEEGYIGTNGVLLGDRVAIQNQQIMEDGKILVNYAERAEVDSMADAPSVAVSKYYQIQGTELVEIENPQQ